MRRRRFVTLALAGAAVGCRQDDDPVAPAPHQAPEQARPPRAKSALEQRAEALAAEHRGFHVVIEPPFVVAGDESPERVEARAAGTIRWAVEHLKRSYFQRDPDAIIEIWLFANSRSYERNAWKMFRERPDTPYGYYSPEHEVLVMNISTGGGTLVHELVHPFMAANFPSVPSWFDEGLASLYEQCGEQDGEIVGYTNWRLPDLQVALQSGNVPSFAALTRTGERPFYEEDPGTNYAQARYLCYYLQERGLLRTFYRDFHANAATDPTGLRTLQRTVGFDDVSEFDAKWGEFVRGLRYA